MCAPFFWGFWWIFPLIGFLLCAGFMAFRFGGGGRGFMSGGPRTTPTGQPGESHR